jgi:hypothetical protein
MRLEELTGDDHREWPDVVTVEESEARQMTTKMHDSTTCNCEMCRFANSTPQESRGVSDAVSESKSVPSGDCEAVAGQCRERSDSSNEQETEQLIAHIHAAMAEDCDCPQHRTGDAEIDPAVMERISTAISQDQAFASLTTVRAALIHTQKAATLLENLLTEIGEPDEAEINM